IITRSLEPPSASQVKHERRETTAADHRPGVLVRGSALRVSAVQGRDPRGRPRRGGRARSGPPVAGVQLQHLCVHRPAVHLRRRDRLRHLPHPPERICEAAMRRLTDTPFPPYAFVPGRTPHPVSDPAGHSYGRTPEPLAHFDPAEWRTCHPYLYGIDL